MKLHLWLWKWIYGIPIAQLQRETFHWNAVLGEHMPERKVSRELQLSGGKMHCWCQGSEVRVSIVVGLNERSGRSKSKGHWLPLRPCSGAWLKTAATLKRSPVHLRCSQLKYSDQEVHVQMSLLSLPGRTAVTSLPLCIITTNFCIIVFSTQLLLAAQREMSLMQYSPAAGAPWWRNFWMIKRETRGSQMKA